MGDERGWQLIDSHISKSTENTGLKFASELTYKDFLQTSFHNLWNIWHVTLHYPGKERGRLLCQEQATEQPPGHKVKATHFDGLLSFSFNFLAYRERQSMSARMCVKILMQVQTAGNFFPPSDISIPQRHTLSKIGEEVAWRRWHEVTLSIYEVWGSMNLTCSSVCEHRKGGQRDRRGREACEHVNRGMCVCS